jgi:DNA-binding Lrp family transcriptional regulator
MTNKRPMMDDLDKVLLNKLQWEFPMVCRPFGALGGTLGTTEEDIMARIGRLKADGVVRQISAIFDTRSLGYKSSLVAMRVRPDRVDAAAAVLNQHPGISHNYKRNHEFNLWFTVAVPPTTSLERTVEVLHRLAGAESTRILQTLRLFKIGVKLDMTGKEDITAQSDDGYSDAQRPAAGAAGIGPDEIATIRELQQDLPVEPEAFAPWAQALGIPVEALLQRAARFQEQGYLRRFAAVLHHREAGFRANAMGVWKVPPERVDELGPKFASFNAVSHCYQRPIYPDWPYNVFTMIHGRSPAECEKVIQAISAATGTTEYAVLYSTKEYKKTRVPYFTAAEEAWERKYLAAASAA